MRLFIILFSITLIIIITNSCRCPGCENQQAMIPFSVLNKADMFIAHQTGTKFFQLYIKPNFGKIKKVENGYFLSYDFFMPEKPFVKGEIRFMVDTLGNLNPDMEVFGIPFCVEFPEDCQFNIDEEKVKSIAIQNGFEQGIKPWKLGFLYDAVYKKYVWHIISTLSESEGEFGYRANGKEMIISPNTGEIIEINNWKIN